MPTHPLRSRLAGVLLAAGVAGLGAAIGRGAENAPEFWRWSPTPPMGWNSYDTYGDSVTEAEVLANAHYLRDHLLAHGWNTVVVDFRWYDPAANSGDLKAVLGRPLTADASGRLLPAPNRFPSSAAGRGFRPLADAVHALGLKFGIHVMRGIPRQAWKANTPIADSPFHAADAALPTNVCPWNPDMFGVDGASAAGQAWYDSLLRLYASWGVDYIKVDDLSRPYYAAEIEALRRAIDRSGRPILFSLSPGRTPLADADHVQAHANLWRISDDFWDRWRNLDAQFDLLAAWQSHGGPGHWPDADMIPLGHLAIRSVGQDRPTRFTRDEQMTLLSLWSLASSPLMLGMNLPDNDAWTEAALTNDELLAIDQDPLGRPASPRQRQKGAEVWVKALRDGSWAVGLFNRTAAPADITVDWSSAGLTGSLQVRDVWAHADQGSAEGHLTRSVAAHGAVLLVLRP
jgi:alpha-galactosidase